MAKFYLNIKGLHSIFSHCFLNKFVQYTTELQKHQWFSTAFGDFAEGEIMFSNETCSILPKILSYLYEKLTDYSVHLWTKLHIILLYMHKECFVNKKTVNYTSQLFCEGFKLASEPSGLFNFWYNQIVKKVHDYTKAQIFCFKWKTLKGC